MSENNDLFDLLYSDSGQRAVAGAFGGIVRWITLKEKLRDGLISVLNGAICAWYLGPISKPIVDTAFAGIVMDNAARQSVSGFLIGTGGVVISGFILDVFVARKKSIIEKNGGSGDPK